MMQIYKYLCCILLIILYLDNFQRYSRVIASSFDPYEVLEVQRVSTQDEIRKAYKRLVKKWHPDKNRDLNAEHRFLEINKAYKILSTMEKRQLYDRTGVTEDQFSDAQSYEHFLRDQQLYQFQYVLWTPPVRKKQSDLINFIFPLVSVLGTLVFIFIVGFLLSKITLDASDQNKRKRQNNADSQTKFSNHKESNTKNEWHPEDPKIPLTEEEKLRRMQTRVWRSMSPLLHELRAETQFGLIRLLKPGCRSIIVLVDSDSKETLLQQFARHVYCLRNNKTFSFGFLLLPKNLNWFRSLLELTLPDDKSTQEKKSDSESITTLTTDTNSNDNVTSTENNAQEASVKNSIGGRELTIKNRLKNINTKHAIGTVLVICGWRLYFSIYHPMHRVSNSSHKTVQLESLGDDDLEEAESQCIGEIGTTNKNFVCNRSKSVYTTEENKQANVENVLNGFPIFLERLLEGTVRRYYIPDWPNNLT